MQLTGILLGSTLTATTGCIPRHNQASAAPSTPGVQAIKQAPGRGHKGESTVVEGKQTPQQA